MENKSTNKILFESIIKYGKIKRKAKLAITEQTINISRKKGLFKKHYKIIRSINFDDIQMYNDKVQVYNKKKLVKLETINKTYKFYCTNAREATKLVDKIIQIKTNPSLLERTAEKVMKVGKTVGETVTTIGLVASTINKHKKEIIKAFKFIKHIIFKV